MLATIRRVEEEILEVEVVSEATEAVDLAVNRIMRDSGSRCIMLRYRNRL
jgi:hypothetical protein